MDRQKTDEGYTIFFSNEEIEKGKKIVVYAGMVLVATRLIRFLVWK